MQLKTLFVASLVGFAVSSHAFAIDKKQEGAIKYRKALMTAIKWNFDPIVATAKGELPYDKAMIARRAAILAELAKLPEEAFVPGTDEGGDTKAKAEIWEQPEKFKAGFEQFQLKSNALAEAARSGDLGAIKARFQETAKTCQSCHDTFKSK